jgi:hypothetical protein
MKSVVIIWSFVLGSFASLAQNPNAEIQAMSDSIIAEGRQLYQLEMASWYGTDVFTQTIPEQKNKVGGYFSYPVGEGTRCLFFDNQPMPEVILTITFDTAYSVKTAQVDKKARAFNENEQALYTIRKSAYALAAQDTFFKRYKNCSLGAIPIIDKKGKRVYFLTNTTQADILLFGNDYLISYNKDNQFVGKKRFHNALTPVATREKGEDGKETAMTYHLHDADELITSTDICTLLFAKKTAYWKQHVSRSPRFTSVWNGEGDVLLFMSNEDFDALGKEK